MADTEHSTSALLPLLNNIFDAHSKPGVSARALYVFLGLNPTVYARWTKKNILQNDFAVEHIDWEGTLPDVEYSISKGLGGQTAQDYALSIDFAKRLAMMTRSAKGEEARLYFLACERIAMQASAPRALSTAEMFLAQAHLNVELEKRTSALEAVVQQQAIQLAAIGERQPPQDKVRIEDWLRRHSKPFLPREVLRQLRSACRDQEDADMFRPDGHDFPVPYFSPYTIAIAYEQVTRQLSFLIREESRHYGCRR